MLSKCRKQVVYFVYLAGLVGLTGCVGCPSRGPIQYVTDTYTTQKVRDALKAQSPGVQSTVEIKTFDHVVSLSGTVKSPEEKEKVVATAQQVSGVRAVLDYMQVGKPVVDQKM